MTFHIHRAVRTAELADGLGALLADPLDDPFAEEVVVVPEHGVERWLAQRLSHRLGGGSEGEGGVCAGVRFVRPASLVTMLTGRELDDPWLPSHLVWPLLATMDGALDELWAAPLARHLGHGDDSVDGRVRQGRRYGLALRLARLLHRYALQRPAVLTAWREGRDEDGAGSALPDDLRWQAELYRRLLEVVDAPPPDLRHTETLDRLRAGDATLDLPGRLSLFGHTRLPVTEVELLRALAEHRDVHLWLPQPSPAAWTALVDRLDGDGVVPRAADRSADAVAHPLLASLGRDSRELVRVLSPPDGDVDELLAAPVAEPTTVLGWLQSDIAANRVPDAAVRGVRVPAPDDRSLSIHACHGPTRQVEVLREVLVGLLEDDPTLEPRDVLVMCPDVEVYAPLIGAAFGLGDHGTDATGVDTHPSHRLRVSLADRSLRATNPLLSVAEQLVALVAGRATASEVLDLIGSDPVRARFRLDDDDLDRLTGWVAATGVRWGLDAAGRSPFALAAEEQNTWAFGLDRLLSGVAVSADGPLSIGGHTLPYDDVGSGSIDLAGRLAEAISRLEAAVGALAEARSAAQWTSTLRESVLVLTDVARDDAWQVGDLDRVLAEASRHAPDDLPLTIADVRVLLADRLAGRPSRASFRTGGLTVCTMVPMRSVPHRVICLVGLDDDSFPRQQSIDGDDVLARTPLTGERDARSEDRQLLLDAVMAAGERLVVTYTGADERSGERRPPAVPLGELIDAAADTAAPLAASGEGPSDGAVADPEAAAVTASLAVGEVRHPLQPFDARNFAVGELTATDEPFSFDLAGLDGATALLRGPTPGPPLLDAPLPAEELPEVSLTQLVELVTSPARTFLRDRLGLAVSWEADEVSDRMPVDLDNLEKWAIGDRGARARLSGRTAEEVWTAELLRGELPPSGLARHTLSPVCERVEDLVSAVASLRGDAPGRTVHVEIALPGGRRLTGAVDGVHDHRLITAGYSSVSAKQLLTTWVRLLALTAGHPEDGWEASVLGTTTKGVVSRSFGRLEPELARARLADLVELLVLARTCVLPLPPKTGHAYAQVVHRDDRKTVSARRSAENEWVPDDRGWNDERSDRWWRLAYGDAAPVDALFAPAAGPGTDLGSLTPRLWDPLLDNLGGGR